MAGWPPEKSVAFNSYVVIRDADGDPITDPTGLAALISRDGGAETTATNTPAVVNTGAATVQFALTAAEMSADEVATRISSTSTGAKDAFQVIYTASKQVDDLLTTADISAAITTGMQINRLDELILNAISAQPTAGSFIGDLTEDNAGTQRFTAAALANSPSGGATTAGVSSVISTELARLRMDELILNALSAQPTAGSFFGDLTEDNAGTQRFTAAALANSPSGGATTAAISAIVATEIATLTDLSTADVSAAVWGAAARTLTANTNFNDISVADVSGAITTGLNTLNDISAGNVLSSVLTEDYASDGAAPTLTQAVMAIQQFLQERAVVGTALTVRKLDGSTTAMEFTLNTATAATSITRTL